MSNPAWIVKDQKEICGLKYLFVAYPKAKFEYLEWIREDVHQTLSGPLNPEFSEKTQKINPSEISQNYFAHEKNLYPNEVKENYKFMQLEKDHESLPKEEQKFGT